MDISLPQDPPCACKSPPPTPRNLTACACLAGMSALSGNVLQVGRATSVAYLRICLISLKCLRVCGYLRHCSHDLGVVKASQQLPTLHHLSKELGRGLQPLCGSGNLCRDFDLFLSFANQLCSFADYAAMTYLSELYTPSSCSGKGFSLSQRGAETLDEKPRQRLGSPCNCCICSVCKARGRRRQSGIAGPCKAARPFSSGVVAKGSALWRDCAPDACRLW